MTEYERQQLQEELEILKTLLDFHVRNRERIAMPNQEFEDYVNAALERIKEITEILEK